MCLVFLCMRKMICRFVLIKECACKPLKILDIKENFKNFLDRDADFTVEY